MSVLLIFSSVDSERKRERRMASGGYEVGCVESDEAGGGGGRKKALQSLLSASRFRPLLRNLSIVLLGSKISLLLFAVPLAVAARCYNLGQASVFGLSLLGLAPLAERISFLSEQITYYTGATVGGLLNATCGNAPELIIALLALKKNKIDVLKWSLLGSILSNLLLVLGSSLFLGSLANYHKEHLFDQKQVNVNISLLLLSAACHILILMYPYAASSSEYTIGTTGSLKLSRTCSIIMLLAYFTCLFFQLKTHNQFFEAHVEEDNENDESTSDAPVIGFASAFAWLVGTTVVVAFLSDYVVGTIEIASDSWGMPVSFISVILLPLVGNAAEHASAVIFAFKNKIDITFGVTLGSATQISMFVVPTSVIVAWIKGIDMDLDFKLLESGSLVMSVLIMAFCLQDGTWHYMKGCVLIFCYLVISAMFFFLKTSSHEVNAIEPGYKGDISTVMKI